MQQDGSLTASIEVTNTGEVSGQEVVQLYVGFKNSTVDRPVKLLRDFDKIHLDPGETKTVRLQVAVKDLAWYDPSMKQWKVEEMEYELYVGGSSQALALEKISFNVAREIK